MDKDAEFISRWKPIHEKSIVKYVLLESLIYLLCIAIVTAIFLFVYPSNSLTISENGLYFVIGFNSISFLIFILFRLISWFRGEKRYKIVINKE